ncbi:MAG: hypothetical protein AAF441_23815 [Pseudomonadota bacterium]
MPNGDTTTLRLERPWQRTGPRRTSKERLRLGLAILTGLYAANAGANGLFKLATQWHVDLLHQRVESLARIDPNAPEIVRMARLIKAADYSSLTEPAHRAIARRAAVKTYLKRHPHLSVGIAIDGDRYTAGRVAGMLKDLNRRLRPYRVTVGLAEPAVRIKIPLHATRDDFLRGLKTGFRSRPDYVIALSAGRCRYSPAGPYPGEPASNRVYSFGWRGLAVIDHAIIDRDLNARLQSELADFLKRDSLERRWKPEDYAPQPANNLVKHQVIGRLRRALVRRSETGEVRPVSLSIGLDQVTPANARAAVGDINDLFRPHGVSFTIKHIYPHRLADQWKWPVEMKKILGRGTSDIYVLLSSSEWVSPAHGPVRGLANPVVGATMVQTGSRAETSRRLAHELGHLFGLPHTLVPGHVMYPNESEIGLKWSPGSRRRLTDNRHRVRWYSSITSAAPYEVAVRLAPVMRRSTEAGRRPNVLEAFASGNVWVRCGAKLPH